MMMKASVASAIPSQISSKPTGKPHLVASLDDLEDLAWLSNVVTWLTYSFTLIEIKESLPFFVKLN